MLSPFKHEELRREAEHTKKMYRILDRHHKGRPISREEKIMVFRYFFNVPEGAPISNIDHVLNVAIKHYANGLMEATIKYAENDPDCKLDNSTVTHAIKAKPVKSQDKELKKLWR